MRAQPLLGFTGVPQHASCESGLLHTCGFTLDLRGCAWVCGAQTLFLTGGIQMITAEVVMAALLGVYFKGAIGDHVPADVGIGILVVVCLFVSGFAYSWGPLAWLVSAGAQSRSTCHSQTSLHLTLQCIIVLSMYPIRSEMPVSLSVPMWGLGPIADPSGSGCRNHGQLCRAVLVSKHAHRLLLG